MATAPRRIQVDSRTFFWKVSYVTPSTISLRVWAEGRASPPWAEVVCRFDDPWLNFEEMSSLGSAGSKVPFELEPLRPKRVAEIIRTAIPQVEPTAGSQRHRFFELSAEGKLVPGEKGAL